MNGKKVDLGKIIDTSDALKSPESGQGKVGPIRKVPIKRYRLPEGGKGPLGQSDHYQETSKEREEFTKG